MNSITSYLPFFGYADASTSLPMWTVLAVSVALDLLLAEILLFRRSEPATLASIVTATIAMTLLLIVKALAAISLVSLNLFGVMLLAWYTLALVVPIASLRLFLCARTRPDRRAALCVALCGMFSAPASLYAHFVEPSMLRVDRASVQTDSLAQLERPLRFGVLADLQCEAIGAHEREAVRLLMAEEPDVILIPGDLLQGSQRLFETWLPDLRALLQELRAPGGVFLVVGDVDGSTRCQVVAEGTHLRVLVNEVVDVELEGQHVRIFGMATLRGGTRFTSSGRERSPTSASLTSLAAFATETEPNCLRILLAHHPRATDLLPEGHNVDLAVTGHTHGGQVALPFIGPPITASPLPRSIARGGLHTYRGLQLYISRGVGLERDQAPRIRFGCPPEVGLLEVTGPRSPGT